METAAPLAVKMRGARGPWEPEWAAPHGFSPGASSCPCGTSNLRSRETTSLSSLSRLVRGGVGSVAWSCGKCLPRSMLEDGVGGALFTGPARLGNESCPHALAHRSSGPGTQTKLQLGQPPPRPPRAFCSSSHHTPSASVQVNPGGSVLGVPAARRLDGPPPVPRHPPLGQRLLPHARASAPRGRSRLLKGLRGGHFHPQNAPAGHGRGKKPFRWAKPPGSEAAFMPEAFKHRGPPRASPLCSLQGPASGADLCTKPLSSLPGSAVDSAGPVR